MMERDFVAQKLKEFQIQEFIDRSLGNVGHSKTIMKKTPLGEKIVIFASRPSLVVGRRGANIKDLTKKLKKKFNLENPQIEIGEVDNLFLDPNIVAERIVSSLERFGTNRFKGIGHKMLERVISSGARGVEIRISGKLPGARARSWRFYKGYVKKCGEAALESVRKTSRKASLKPGVVGIQVSIMPPGIRLPDDIRWREATVEPNNVPEEPKQKKTKKKAVKKRRAKKKSSKKKIDSDSTPEISDSGGEK
jgi:small subunit ribosomal protein S3